MGSKLKQLKRPPAGRSKGSASAVADASSAKTKKPRGPKPYISMPSMPKQQNGNLQDDEALEQEAEEEARLAALDAQDMVAGTDGSDDDDDSDHEGAREPAPKAAKDARAGINGAKFLLNLDQKGLSRSRAEEKRLQKGERKAQKQLQEEELAAHKEDSDSDASTDMEGASEGSSAEEDDDDGEFSGFDSADFKSDLDDDEDQDDFDSVDPTDSSEDDDDENNDKAERKYQERLRVRRKRQQAEEAEEAEAKKRRKLPVRGDAGQWQDGSDEEGEQDEDDEDDEDDEEQSALTKSAKGKVQPASRAIHKVKAADAPSSEDEDEEDSHGEQQAAEPVSTILSGARFGMQAPYTIMTLQPRSARVVAARDQIARLATDIVGDPEVSLGLLRRLSVFAQRKIFRPEHDSMARAQDLPEAIEVDDAIRGAALMSLTAVYVDILPGYRIRALTEQEQQEKVNQETARRREWEQGLVDVYRQHLEICEKVLRAKVSISSLALRSMCILLTRATHFNYRTNLIGALVSQLSKRSWSPDSQLCSDSLLEVLRRDLAGDASLEVVRLLNRMIKERGYKVNARVLNILLHLRLRSELGNKRADTVRADKEKKSSISEKNGKKFRTGKGKAKPGDVRKGQGEHLSKKQIKLQREMKEVEKDMKEAEAEVDQEERERNQTETLKLLFVLYFSILKADSAPDPLLGAALEGLSKFAHRVNVDFFRDLLAVLRNHVKEARSGAIARSKILQSGAGADSDGEDNDEEALDEPHQDDSRKALLCLVTAFELLSGQGEALNIDLSDMVSHLYAILLPLCSSSSIEEIPTMSNPTVVEPSQQPQGGKKKSSSDSNSHLLRTDADLLLRGLDLCLLRPRLSDLPSERSAAFIKRILICALYTPTTTTLRLLGVVRSMIGKDPKLEALLDTEDRAKNGKFDPGNEDQDVELARPLAAGEVAWELHILAKHVNVDIATTAQGILALQSN
ncbi:unnamed protein product [Sympodiomycopsis kandeliae]